MADAESFDAFYARTVWRVTSQMHERTGDDPLADHAIREAYAKAYQQWYQVAGYRDSEDWVLAAAQDAYERRRATVAVDEARPRGRRAAGDSSGTWPGIYRPRKARPPQSASQPPPSADPDATIGASAAAHAVTAEAGVAGAALAATGSADQPTLAPGASGDAAAANLTGQGESGAALLPPDPVSAVAGPANPARRGRARRPWWPPPASRRTMIIGGLAAAVVVIAAISYAIAGGGPGSTASASGQHGARTGPQILRAGQTGPRSAIPWALVGSGWALAESSGNGAGRYTTYLVDPAGGKYDVTAMSASSEPVLMAWSGDKKLALFGAASQDGTGRYQVLTVRTGGLTGLNLPAGVVATGFTRPHGLAILAVRAQARHFRLQRYGLNGSFQAAVATLPRTNGAVWPATGCAAVASQACAISSPQGTADVWGIAGDDMAVVSNAGGRPRTLRPAGAGSCVPLSWWDADTVLASCAPGTGSARLWLVPGNGSAATPLTPAAGPAGGIVEDAWQADGTTYISASQPGQCGSATTAGLDIRPATAAAIGASVRIPGSQGNLGTVVATSGRRLLVLAQTRCPGPASLIWLNPATGASQPVLRAGSQAGVIAAVPFGNGPSAVSAGS